MAVRSFCVEAGRNNCRLPRSKSAESAVKSFGYQTTDCESLSVCPTTCEPRTYGNYIYNNVCEITFHVFFHPFSGFDGLAQSYAFFRYPYIHPACVSPTFASLHCGTSGNGCRFFPHFHSHSTHCETHRAISVFVFSRPKKVFPLYLEQNQAYAYFFIVPHWNVWHGCCNS